MTRSYSHREPSLRIPRVRPCLQRPEAPAQSTLGLSKPPSSTPCPRPPEAPRTSGEQPGASETEGKWGAGSFPGDLYIFSTLAASPPAPPGLTSPLSLRVPRRPVSAPFTRTPTPAQRNLSTAPPTTSGLGRGQPVPRNLPASAGKAMRKPGRILHLPLPTTHPPLALVCGYHPLSSQK